MYKVQVNKSSEFILEENGDNFLQSFIDGKITKEDVASWKLEKNGELMFADVEELDTKNKKVVVKINQNTYEVDIKEPLDLYLDKIGISTKNKKKAKNLLAPMPGMVLKIVVGEGDVVKQGEPLLVLEAMKMENVFKAPADVTIKEIKVQEKVAVEKGQELMTFI